MVSDVSLTRRDAPTVHTTAIARALAEHGLDVDLVARGPDPRIDGVRFRGGPPLRSNDRRRVPVVNARAARVLLRRRLATDALYVRENWGLLPTMALARLLRYRIVTEVNGIDYGPGRTDPHTLRGRLTDRAKRLFSAGTWRLSTWIVPVTAALGDVVVEDFGVDARRIVVVENGVDPDEIVPVERGAAIAAAGLDPERRYVAFVGALGERVAWDTFVEAFAIVAATRPDATLLIVGDGPQERDVDALVERLDLGAQVIRTGHVDPVRVAQLTGAATVCLVALRPYFQARIGASPMKLTEYFARGRAVVAMAMAGVQEMIEESDAGVVVPPDDPEALAAAIGDFLDDPERADACGAAGRRAALERWSWHMLADRIVPLLEADPKGSTD
jgi:glycosyltransferase involved in cell wall biosynthesis